MSNENTKLQNVRKSCKTAFGLINIASTLVTVCMLCAFTGAALCFIFHATIDEALTASPDMAGSLVTSISILGANMTMTNSPSIGISLGATCLTAALALVFLKIALVFIRKIFYTILKSESPFSDDVIGTLKKSFIVITVFVALSTGIITAAILGIFLWCTYSIFQYGSILQQQSDETL